MKHVTNQLDIEEWNWGVGDIKMEPVVLIHDPGHETVIIS